MNLTTEQKQQVAQWINEGVGLSDVQKRIDKDFAISMTYMDVRFLVDDLDLELPNPVSDEPEPEDDQAAVDADVEFVGGAVSVELDKIQRPGAVASGSVNFSDGVKCSWQVDQMGRLGIIPGKEGYQPPEADMPEFQQLLQQELQSKGF